MTFYSEDEPFDDEPSDPLPFVDPSHFYRELYKNPPPPLCLIDFPFCIQKMAYDSIVNGYHNFGPLRWYLNHLMIPGIYKISHKLTLLHRLNRIMDAILENGGDYVAMQSLQHRVTTMITFYRNRS